MGSPSLICPYCGQVQPVSERCIACAGLFEPLSRQATHNAMGPWFIRDARRPFHPGCSFQTLLRMIERGRVTPATIIRGPSTGQFWTVARRVQGIAHLLGFCHECDRPVAPGDTACGTCGARLGSPSAGDSDRDRLGLPEIRPLPWEQPATGNGRTEAGTPRGGSISCFATDDELRGMAIAAGTGAGSASEPADTAGQATRGDAWVRPDSEPTAAAPAATEGADDRSLRAAQRALLRQRQLTWRVAVLAFIAAAIAAASSLGWLLSAETSRVAVPAAEEGPPAEPAPLPAEAEPEAAGDDAEPGPGAAPEPVASEPRAVENPEAMFEAAGALLVAAREEQRPLAERAADAEEAVSLLQRLADAPREQHPADLHQHLEEARRLADRLRMELYFP